MIVIYLIDLKTSNRLIFFPNSEGHSIYKEKTLLLNYLKKIELSKLVNIVKTKLNRNQTNQQMTNIVFNK